MDTLEAQFFETDLKGKLAILKDISRKNTKNYIGFLEGRLDDKHRKVRKNAAKILNALQDKLNPDVKNIDDYVNMLCAKNDGKLNERLNRLGHFCLESLGEEAVPELLKYLDNQEKVVYVLNALSNIAEERIVPMLISIYPLVNDVCKMELLEHIAFMNVAGNRDFFLQCAQNSGNETIRKRAKELALTALKKSAHETLRKKRGIKRILAALI